MKPARAHRWRRPCAAALATTLCATVQTAAAQEYPEKSILVVAGMAAGGGADVNARRLAQMLNKILKQNVVVDNVAGAAGNLAAQTVSTSTPDGYTLLFASHPILAINPLLYEKLPYNPGNLAPVVLVSQTPHILLVNPALPVVRLSDLVSHAKSRPGTLNYGTGGIGTSIHLAAELMQNSAGVALTYIPFRGAAPAFTALVGNDIQLLFDSSTTAIGHLRGGRVRGIAIASSARLPVLPDLPTFNESGLPGFEAGVGHGMLVRAATPPARVAMLNQAINTALADPDYKKQMTDLGVTLVGGTPDDFRAYLASERRKWGELIQKRGIKVE